HRAQRRVLVGRREADLWRALLQQALIIGVNIDRAGEDVAGVDRAGGVDHRLGIAEAERIDVDDDADIVLAENVEESRFIHAVGMGDGNGVGQIGGFIAAVDDEGLFAMGEETQGYVAAQKSAATNDCYGHEMSGSNRLAGTLAHGPVPRTDKKRRDFSRLRRFGPCRNQRWAATSSGVSGPKS